MRPSPQLQLRPRTRGGNALNFAIKAALSLAVIAEGATLAMRFAAPSAPAAAPPAPAVPVVMAPVQQHDVSIILGGLGTVQALNTATIRSQVTGLLQTVNFVEGQQVHRGDALAQIDPRPYQARLEQAQAQLTRDQAQLANIEVNLNRNVPLLSKGFATLNQYYAILEVDPEFQAGPNALQRIYVKSQSGNEVPISQIASFKSTLAPLAVNHQGQFPSVTLSFNLAPGVAIGQAVTEVQKATASLNMPGSMATKFQGNAQAFQSSLSSTPPLILAALFAVYLILGMLYESTIHLLTILSTLPSAGLGALATLMVFGRPLDVIGIIGIILLIGIVKKNGIMLVDFALQAERERGLSTEDAIHEACLLRFRPILMTTLCALLGGVPLMLGTGTGSEIRQPLGYAMVGGLLVSQVLTLFTTPVVYLYMDKLSHLVGRRRRTEAVPAAAE